MPVQVKSRHLFVTTLYGAFHAHALATANVDERGLPGVHRHRFEHTPHVPGVCHAVTVELFHGSLKVAHSKGNEQTQNKTAKHIPCDS